MKNVHILISAYKSTYSYIYVFVSYYNEMKILFQSVVFGGKEKKIVDFVL